MRSMRYGHYSISSIWMAFLLCNYNFLHPLLMHIKTPAHTNLSQLDFAIFWCKCDWCLCKTNLHDARGCGWLLGHCYYVFAKTFWYVVRELPQSRLSRNSLILWIDFCCIGKAANVGCPTFYNSSLLLFISLPQARSTHLSRSSPLSGSPLWTHPSCSPSDSSETSLGSCWT